MADVSRDALLGRFKKRLEILQTRLKRPEKLRAPLEGPPPASLFRLPFELRLQIYHYCIPRKQVIDVCSPRFDTWWHYQETNPKWNLDCASSFEDCPEVVAGAVDSDTFEDKQLGYEDYKLDFEDISHPNRAKNNVFLLSKQISNEALNVLYGENFFKLYLNGKDEYYLRKNFTESNIRRMRYLLLVAQPRGASYPHTIPNSELWSSILPALKVLRIIAEQPVRASSYYGAPTLEQEMDRWFKWIGPFLLCFGRHLSDKTIIEVDADGQAETIELVQKCLPHSFREIRCPLVGDLIFQRGLFSIDSSYWDDDGPKNSLNV